MTLRLSRLQRAIDRQSLVWWHDPRLGRPCLRNRAGRIFHVQVVAGGLLLSPYHNP